MGLATHLARQQRRLDALLETLREETSALARARVDGDELARLAETKQRLFQELDTLERQRRQAQARLGYAEGREGARQAAFDADCLDAWQALMALAERVRELNATNGELILERMRQNQQMLDFLREAAGTPLYGPDGQARQRDSRVSSRA
ncbi:flagella synthesis protein FlgN [Halomonas sp. 328]|uniref:flagella synthesis protein FlgN n=1 Tax=Halomonas sp. 328 TaxID=2776704 RepID=UPI0018A7A36B|nr:flagellar protein FlgN [Halomonas sp. 328]MBF8222245.1 flagellar protein FlgN [Halomonas sp. 328]